MYKIKIDRSLCIGAASCTAVSQVFQLDAEGKAVIRKKDGTIGQGFVSSSECDEKEEILLNAARSCPTNAIVIVKEEGDKETQVWP